jgi:mRNA interferase RelE/StbE
MRAKILYKRSVERDLKKLGTPLARRIMGKIETELAEDPHSCPPLKGQFAGLRRYRVGEHRVIYAIVGEDVVVLRIAHRREVYRRKL